MHGRKEHHMHLVDGDTAWDAGSCSVVGLYEGAESVLRVIYLREAGR